MADKEPELYRAAFGSLRPVTPAAEQSIKQLDPKRSYRVEIKGVKGNTRRLALYWVCLKVACEQLSDAVDGILTPRNLHHWLKRDLGLAKPIVSKRTGQTIDHDYESVAFEKMQEGERAAYIDAALERLSKLIGCDVTTLRNEAQAQFGEAA